MNKPVRLIDFQVFVGAAGLADGEQRRINHAFFTTYEPVRLWIKDHNVLAPFRKIVVRLTEGSSSSPWHGRAAILDKICQVTESLDLDEIVRRASDHRWVLGIVEHALGCIADSTGWRSVELEGFVRTMSEQPLPIVHFFERLARVEKASGMKCVLWMSLRPGKSELGVRLGERDVRVLSTPEPLFLEDDFPVAKSAIREREYVLLDKAGIALARVGIDDGQVHLGPSAKG
jgi:hypothetical protein